MTFDPENKKMIWKKSNDVNINLINRMKDMNSKILI